MTVVYGAIMPHPPILIPQIGGTRIKDAEKSKRSLQEIAKRIKSIDREIDTIVVITPHGEVGQTAVPIYTSHIFEGHFGFFGFPKPLFKFKGDAELGNTIVKEGRRVDAHVAPIPESFLDHGVLVPMFYPVEAGVKKPVLPIAIAFTKLQELHSFGKVLRAAAKELGRKIAVIASADLSHRLTADAPAGFDPAGKEFDEKLVKLVGDYDVDGILNFDSGLAEKAGQDALWSIAILLGALDGLKVKHEVLSYEGPFGVGYMVADFKVEGHGA
jgi:AmmeMemoRadiSam system protein B